MKDNEIIIRIFPYSEGGLNYDIYVDQDCPELRELESDDGGICTSGCHDDGCKNDDCEGCEEAMAKPYTRKDWENALGMAAEQALDALFPEE